MTLVRWFGVFAVTVIGFFLPRISERVAAYKCGKLGEELPPLRAGFRRAALILAPTVAAVGAFLVLRAGGLASSLEHLCILLLWIPFAYVDQRIRIIPNELTLLFLLLAVVFRLLEWSWTSLLHHAIGSALVLLLFFLAAVLSGKGSVGLGDVKLAAVIGFSVGYPNALYALLAMALCIGVFSMIGMLLRRLTIKSKLPYAAFLMFGAFAAKLLELYALI